MGPVGMVLELESHYIRKSVRGYSQRSEEEGFGNIRRVRTDLGDRMCSAARTAS